jgi:hypothetical protein
MTDPPPRMLPRPSEAPEPLEPVRSSETLTRLHAVWSRMHAGVQPSPGSRVKRAIRTAARRAIGPVDDELSGDLIRAVDALAARCDELSQRLAAQEELTAELTASLGQEVTRLRAAVAHWHGAPEDGRPPNGP